MKWKIAAWGPTGTSGFYGSTAERASIFTNYFKAEEIRDYLNIKALHRNGNLRIERYGIYTI